MPDEDIGFAAIESNVYGNVLWVCRIYLLPVILLEAKFRSFQCALDHGRRRVGFSLTKELQEKYGNQMTEEQVKIEAANSVAPFVLEFVEVDWHTIYKYVHLTADWIFLGLSIPLIL
jgi:hypothetical protein